MIYAKRPAMVRIGFRLQLNVLTEMLTVIVRSPRRIVYLNLPDGYFSVCMFPSKTRPVALSRNQKRPVCGSYPHLRA
jgi:hypothetical protein